MLIIDPRTLSLAVGLGSLLFALLVTLYIARSPAHNHIALKTWRWSKLVGGSGFLLNLVQKSLPGLLPVALGNMTQLLAFALELAAFCWLLERRGWRRPLLGYLVVMLPLFQFTAWLGNENQRLMLFSLASGVLYTTMAVLLLGNNRRESLITVIGVVNAMAALFLFLRVAQGLFSAPLSRFDGDLITLALYTLAYVVLIVNGFGFLLLAKQADDRKLQKAHDSLAEAEAEQRQLLSIASHEFRTPAAMIKTSLDSLRFLDEALSPEVTRRLDNIRSASIRLTDLAHTLITQDRLMEQALRPTKARFDLREMVSDVVRAYPDGSVPLCRLPEAPLPIVADAALLRIALHNLIDNAQEHNQPEHGPVVVALVCENGNAEIRVADHGAGIADAEKENVFRRFHGVQDDLTRGIGLSIVRVMAHAHGGDVTVQDNPPQGSVFVMHLPLAGH